jgi:C-terminal processing protease CtpA/Prc
VPRWFALPAALLAAACGGAPVPGSIGAVLGRDELTGAVHVREVPEGRTADRSGVLPGDRLKMVDGILVDALDPPRLRRLLRGPVGSRVTLTLVRGSEVIHVEVVREPPTAPEDVASPHEPIE